MYRQYSIYIRDGNTDMKSCLQFLFSIAKIIISQTIWNNDLIVKRVERFESSVFDHSNTLDSGWRSRIGKLSKKLIWFSGCQSSEYITLCQQPRFKSLLIGCTISTASCPLSHSRSANDPSMKSFCMSTIISTFLGFTVVFIHS